MTANNTSPPVKDLSTANSAAPRTDFHRNVHCILGLPFDAITTDQAQQLLNDAIAQQRRCFFSTPNLNFLISASRDPAFRDSVLRSDLSFVDGMPLVWLARLLGIPIPERVAGSTVFERLREQNTMPLKVYFFGGQDGVAQHACEVINAEKGSMVCCGFYSPGFGTTEGMSTDEIVEAINDVTPDLLVVALGAKRGQEWIEYNLARLRVPAVSHLGAVVNFVAGTVSRAPQWVGKVGLEWLWRIKEEPALWRRYRDDGFALGKFFVTRILPSLFRRTAAGASSKISTVKISDIEISAHSCITQLRLSGSWYSNNLMPMRDALQDLTRSPCDVELDMQNVVAIDSAALGLLLLLFGHQTKIQRGFKVGPISPDLKRFFVLNCADFLLSAHVAQHKRPVIAAQNGPQISS